MGCIMFHRLRQTTAQWLSRVWARLFPRERMPAFLLAAGAFLRRLLGWLWRPIGWLLRPFVALARAVWRFLGRMGLALRNLLRWFIWQPLWFIATPLRWLFRFLLVPFLFRPLWRYAIAPVGRYGRDWLQRRWQGSAPARRRWQRRWVSQRAVFLARLRLRLRRPKPPTDAIYVADANTGLSYVAAVGRQRRQARLRLVRIASGLIALNLVLVGVGSIITSEPVPSLASALPAATITSPPLPATTTPSPTPTVTPLPPTPTTTPTPQPLPTIAVSPWLTPDLLSGGSLLFTMRQNGNSDIYALTVGQSRPVRLTSHPAADRDPAWSPDGSQIAFASHRDGNWDIYVLDLRLATTRRITSDPAFDAGPGWSPDGEWLVYESYRSGNLDIHITRADGSGEPIQLTRHAAPDFSPVWSPGGRHIAFTSWRTGNKDIFIIPLDGAQDAAAVNITQSPDRQEDHPRFRPDGEALAFDDDSSDFDLVYETALAQYAPDGLPTSLGQGRQPTWSPDGGAILYVHEVNGQTYLIAGNAAAWGIAPQAFVSAGWIEDPFWSAAPLPANLAARLPDEGRDAPLFTEVASRSETADPPYLLQPVAVRAPSPYLSDRVDDSFAALQARVLQEAGFDFLAQLDNMFEPLSTQPLPGQSRYTWNKAGRAFDFSYRTALSFDPQVEVLRQDRGYQVFWQVMIKAAAQDGTQGEPLRELPWDFRARYGQDALYYDEGGKWKDAIPAGYYVDLTALAADYGWQRVPADTAWRTYFPSIRFWHFEKTDGLTWNAAMAELYPAADLLSAFGELP